MNPSPVKISIVIPALNEETTVGTVIDAAGTGLRKSGLPGEIIIADNGSTDATKKIALARGAGVVTVRARGYGSALRGGIKKARGKFIVIGDADGSYDFSDLFPFIDALRRGFDFVIGNRYRGCIEKGAMPWLHRHLGTPLLTALMNGRYETGIHDVNCGMRAFLKSSFDKLDCRTTGMEFATEMIVRAAQKGMRLTEVPCNLYRDKRNRKPSLKTWQDGWRHLRLFLLFSPFKLFFIPGLALSFLGLAGLILLPLPLGGLDEKHLITSAGIVLFGMQIVSFGLAAKFYSQTERFDDQDGFIHAFKRAFTLKRGLRIGGTLVLIGVAILLMLGLSHNGLFHLSLPELIRYKLGIWGIMAVLFGIHTIFSSFFLSFSACPY